MEIIIQPTPEAATSIAVRIFENLIRSKPAAVLGLATGSTPLGLYRQLVGMGLDWSSVTTFNLDEYVGLPPGHPASYHHFMTQHLFAHVNARRENIHVPAGLAENIPLACENYEAEIRQVGGIDLQLLGIGTDGHIGFNEQTSSLASRTRIKTLTAQTRLDNAKYFDAGAEMPHHVITMGIGTILDARHCLLLAFGAEKARAVSEAIEGAVTAMNPASALQMHPKVTVCLDEAAASELKLRSYYDWVFENKPSWQNL